MVSKERFIYHQKTEHHLLEKRHPKQGFSLDLMYLKAMFTFPI